MAGRIHVTYSRDENPAAQCVPFGELIAEFVALEDGLVHVGVVEQEHVRVVAPRREVLLNQMVRLFDVEVRGPEESGEELDRVRAHQVGVGLHQLAQAMQEDVVHL